MAGSIPVKRKGSIPFASHLFLIIEGDRLERVALNPAAEIAGPLITFVRGQRVCAEAHNLGSGGSTPPPVTIYS